MKDRQNKNAGFTLLEMIGVLAIMSILAATIAPNVIHSIDRAAVRAETENLSTLASYLKLYTKENGSLPTPSNWSSALLNYADAGLADIETNKRGRDRAYFVDPASSPAPRVMILSSMRNDLALPSSLSTSARFDDLWNTADGDIPPTSTWSGWSAWNAVDSASDYLVIQRINLTPLYQTDLKTWSVALNNPDVSIGGYELRDRDGNVVSSGQIPANDVVTLTNLYNGDRVNIYSDSARTNLVFTHFVNNASTSFNLVDLI